jgi:YggT family protein
VSLGTVAGYADLVARSLALGVVVLAGAVALTHWAVRRRALQPFGGWPRLVRNLSDPLLRPIERRLTRSGGNPQDATYWLFGLAVVAGLLLITVVRWVFGFVQSLIALGDARPGVWLAVLVGWAFTIVTAALFIRVIGSWFGATQHTRWMRPFIWLTDWLIVPIRRFLPPTGIIDWSPLVAYLVLLLLRHLVFSALF